ncbi:hypothetical protein BY996DRAFT_8028097, partial [Phakopsora pachyrhizi]
MITIFFLFNSYLKTSCNLIASLIPQSIINLIISFYLNSILLSLILTMASYRFII